MNNSFEDYQKQIADWIVRQDSKNEFKKAWENAIIQGENISQTMEIKEATLIKVIGL